MNEIQIGRMGYKQFVSLLEGIRGLDMTLILFKASIFYGKILLRVEREKILLANVTHIQDKYDLSLIRIDYEVFIGIIRRCGRSRIFASSCIDYFFWRVGRAIDIAEIDDRLPFFGFEFEEKLIKPPELKRWFKKF